MGVVAPGKTFTCSKCGRSFANEMDLKYHQCPGKKVVRNDQLSDGIG